MSRRTRARRPRAQPHAQARRRRALIAPDRRDQHDRIGDFSHPRLRRSRPCDRPRRAATAWPHDPATRPVRKQQSGRCHATEASPCGESGSGHHRSTLRTPTDNQIAPGSSLLSLIGQAVVPATADGSGPLLLAPGWRACQRPARPDGGEVPRAATGRRSRRRRVSADGLYQRGDRQGHIEGKQRKPHPLVVVVRLDVPVRIDHRSPPEQSGHSDRRPARARAPAVMNPYREGVPPRPRTTTVPIRRWRPPRGRAPVLASQRAVRSRPHRSRRPHQSRRRPRPRRLWHRSLLRQGRTPRLVPRIAVPSRSRQNGQETVTPDCVHPAGRAEAEAAKTPSARPVAPAIAARHEPLRPIPAIAIPSSASSCHYGFGEQKPEGHTEREANGPTYPRPAATCQANDGDLPPGGGGRTPGYRSVGPGPVLTHAEGAGR